MKMITELKSMKLEAEGKKSMRFPELDYCGFEITSIGYIEIFKGTEFNNVFEFRAPKKGDLGGVEKLVDGVYQIDIEEIIKQAIALVVEDRS